MTGSADLFISEGTWVSMCCCFNVATSSLSILFCELLKFREYLINEYVIVNINSGNMKRCFNTILFLFIWNKFRFQFGDRKSLPWLSSFYLTNYEISKRIWIGKWPNYWFNKDKLQFNDTTLVEVNRSKVCLVQKPFHMDDQSLLLTKTQ